MRGIKLSAIAVALCLTFACRTSGQVQDPFEGWCDSLRNASLPDLVQFLNGVVPDEKNSYCVAWTIRKLGKERYEPAITALVRLLDFRRPATQREKLGFSNPGGIGGIWDLYPAAGALDLIGKKSFPDVLNVIEADSSSAQARENAVAVWMEIHRYSDEHPKGVALFRQEEINAKNDGTKQRLRWAVHEALRYCGPREEAACKAAAKTGEF